METMRILLLNPPKMLSVDRIPTASPPLTLGYLAAMLQNEFDVQFLDCMVEGINHKKYLSKELNMWGTDPDELKLRMSRWEPHMVIILADESSQDEMLDTVTQIYKDHSRALGRPIYIATVGDHSSAGPRQILKKKFIDFAIAGEPELPVYQLCQALSRGQDYSSIDGLTFRDKKGKTISNEKKQITKDVNQIPFPARHLMGLEKYYQAPCYFQPAATPFTNMILSRGCGNNCLFCPIPANQGNRTRVRSPKSVMEEILLLVQHFGMKEIYFEDDNLFWNLEYTFELCQRLTKANLGILWSCPKGLVARGYNRRLLVELKKSGCYSLTFNFESGSDRVLGDIINSPNDRDIITNLVKDLKKLGISVRGNFRVGWPYESRQEIKETYEFIADLALDDFRINTAVPYPGTPFWDKCIKEELFAKPFKFREYLTNDCFINSTNFTVEGLPVLMEENEKNLRKRLGKSGTEQIMDSIGGILGKVMPLGGAETRKKGKGKGR